MTFGKTKIIGVNMANAMNPNFDHFSATRFASSYIDLSAGVFNPANFELS